MRANPPAYLPMLEYWERDHKDHLSIIMGYPANKCRVDLEVSPGFFKEWHRFDEFFEPLTDDDRMFCVEGCRDLLWTHKPKIDHADRFFVSRNLWLDNLNAYSEKDQYNIESMALNDWVWYITNETESIR